MKIYNKNYYNLLTVLRYFLFLYLQKVSEEVINAINIVKEYCKSHEEFEDCRHCVLGDGVHNCGCSSPWVWDIRK